MAQLEDDLRQLVVLGVDGAGARLGEVRLARARRAAAWLAEHEGELRARGLLSFGERPGDLHLAPALEEALAEAVGE